MLFVKVPKEIREYEPKIFVGLSKRQILWGSLAFLLGGLTFFVGHFFIPISILSYLVMAVALVPFACGFVPVQGMPADQYLRITYNYYKKRKVGLRYNNGSDGGDINEAVSKETKKRNKQLRKERKLLRKAGENYEIA